ncbi:MAG: T9SS type A sorting domain-containing protein [Crocinitomix sp.]|nr:T9SS type A sorting domain-containing protein [Crocinitomix sp.]
MKLLYTFNRVLACLVFLMSGSLVYGQIIGTDAYLIGDNIEIGINGSGGHEGASELPGSHNRSNLVITSPVYFGFVANPQLDAWATYDGDFFSPGTPENGFGMEIAGVNYGNNATGGPLNEIAGDLVSYTEDGDCITVEWEGTAGGVRINVKYNLLATNLFYTTEITMVNESGADLTDVYYYRNVDPDNNVSIGGGYPTTNTIVAQSDTACGKSLVSATQARPLGAGPGTSYVGFGALGEDFRVAHGGFSNRDASDIWNGTGGLTGTLGTTITADQAIALAYKGDILAGDSLNFTYAVVLDDDSVEEAFEGLYYIEFEAVGVSGGSAASECNVSVDTAATCGGNPVTLIIQGPNTEDFDWVWSPADGLSETEGTETEATPSETTTYTVTGTPTDGCLETPIVKTIVIEYLDGPLIEISDTSVVCGAFDLTTLEYSDLNGVTGTVTYFFSEIPDSATQVDPQWPSDFIVEGDSVYLMIADTVNGCFDYALVEIDFAAPANAGANTTTAYCGDDESIINVYDLLADDAEEGGVIAEIGVSGAFDDATGDLDLSLLSPGAYNFTYIVGEAPCPVDTSYHTVVVYPDLVLTLDVTDASCGADDGSITASVTGGVPPYSYDWSTGEITETISDLAPGIYFVFVTDGFGCVTSDTVDVKGADTDMEIDKLHINHVSCYGGDNGSIAIVMEGGVAPYTYDWSTGDTDAEIEGLTAGIYTVTVTDATGCSITETFEVLESDPIDVSITIDGDCLISNEDGATYQWVTCPDYEAVDGETDQEFCLPEYCGDSAYAVIITNGDGCVDTSDCINVIDEGVSIGENGMMEISIYPNPTDGTIFVSVDAMDQNYQLTVIDAEGRIILNRTVSNAIEAIDLSNASNGIYFVRINTSGGTMTKRVTVNK